jgi:hypothetical protein
MRYVAFIIISCVLYSCSTPAQNYYPDKINDTAFYAGDISYKDNYHHNRDYKDTILVIRIAKDSIALISPHFSFTEDLAVMGRASYWAFHLNDSAKYLYEDSAYHVHYFTLYDFSKALKLEIQSKTKHDQIGTIREYQAYTFSGKRSFFR